MRGMEENIDARILWKISTRESFGLWKTVVSSSRAVAEGSGRTPHQVGIGCFEIRNIAMIEGHGESVGPQAREIGVIGAVSHRCTKRAVTEEADVVTASNP